MSVIHLKSNVRDPLSTVEKISKVKVKSKISIGNYSCKENRKSLDKVAEDVQKLKHLIFLHYRTIQEFMIKQTSKKLIGLMSQVDEINNIIESTEYSLKKLMIDNVSFIGLNILDPGMKKDLESNTLNFSSRFGKFVDDFYSYKNTCFEDLQSKIDESLISVCQKELNQKVIPSISLFHMYFTAFTDILISSGFITTK